MAKFSIFHIQGGAGKHVAATAVAKAIKNNHPDRKLIVVCAWPELFENLKFVDRVYRLGATQNFYRNYVHDKDSIIFYQEPYYTTDHIHKKLPLIENWCKMYGIQYNGELPEVPFNKIQKERANDRWKKIDGKPIMVLHTNGGPIMFPPPNLPKEHEQMFFQQHMHSLKPYSWTRDMPQDLAKDLVSHYHKDYTIYQVTKLNSPKLENTIPIFAMPTGALTLMELFSIFLEADKCVLIDSCLQHAAAGVGKKSTVVWIGTSPKTFGYKMHDNICADIPNDFKLPKSYLFDFSFEGLDNEYPFKKGQKIIEVDKVIESIERQ